jgi:O-antigen ligase
VSNGIQTLGRVLPAVIPTLGFALLTALLVLILQSGNALPLLTPIVGGIAALAIINWPYWGVVIMLASATLGIGTLLPGARFTSIPYLVGGLLMIPLAIGIVRGTELRVFRFPQTQIHFAIAGLYLLSTAWSSFYHPPILVPQFDRTEWMLVSLLARLAFLLCLVSFVVSRAQIQLATWIVIVVIVMSSLNSLVSVMGAGAAARRAASDFGAGMNPNRLAFMCFFAAALLWFYASMNGRGVFGRAVTAVCLLPSTTGLATGSRNALLQAIVFVILLIKETSHDVVRRAGILLFVAPAAMLVISIIPAAVLERATNFNPNAEGPGKASLENRVDQLRASVRLFAAHPILGVGIGNFESISPSAHASGYEGHGPHNAYLRAAAEGGIGVLALYLLLFAVNFQMLAEVERSGPKEVRWIAKGLKAGLVLFLVSSLTADAWLSDYLYVILGLTMALGGLPRPSPARAALSRRPFRSIEAFAR